MKTNGEYGGKRDAPRVELSVARSGTHRATYFRTFVIFI